MLNIKPIIGLGKGRLIPKKNLCGNKQALKWPVEKVARQHQKIDGQCFNVERQVRRPAAFYFNLEQDQSVLQPQLHWANFMRQTDSCSRLCMQSWYCDLHLRLHVWPS